MSTLLSTSEIEFTTVALNERGEIQDRPVHHIRQFAKHLGYGLDQPRGHGLRAFR